MLFLTVLILGSALLIAFSFYAQKDMKRQRSVTLPNTSKEGQGPIYRNILTPDRLISQPEREIFTLHDMFNFAIKNHSANNAIGHRSVLDMKKEEKIIKQDNEEKKTILVYPKLSSFHWITYRQLGDLVDNVSKNMKAQFKFSEGTPVMIFAETQPGWIQAAHACWAQNWKVVTAYANLGNEGLVHCFSSSDSELVITTADKIDLIISIAHSCEKLKHIIVFDEEKVSSTQKEKIEKANLEYVTWSALAKPAPEDVSLSPPKPADVAVLMFTSGSTGLPKAVMMSHSNLIASLAGLSIPTALRPTDVYIAYLPLAHVLELVAENLLLYKGASLGYGSPRTLIDAGVWDCKGDITELCPTLMAGVPAVWERIRKAAADKIETKSANVQKLFHFAYDLKRQLLNWGFPTFVLDNTIFKPTRQATGGRLRLIISGGAPISSESQEFLRICLCVPCLQGYGLTETCGSVSVLPHDSLALRVVGAPIPCTEVRLVDVPQLKYWSAEGKGEIWVRGPNIVKGYYKDEKKTKEDFDEDGWFHTGDVGKWNSDGTLSIIDRVKNITKLSHGEYIALESLESSYSTSQFVEQLCVYADGDRDSCIALIVPRKKTLMEWAEKNGVSGSYEDVCKDLKAHNAVLKSLHDIAREKAKPKVEYPSAVVLFSEEWTPDSGMLTAAMKLNRGAIKSRFIEQINAAYSK